MNKGDKRRRKRKYKVRYDRIGAVLISLIVVILVATSCVKSILKKDNPVPDDTSVSESETTTTTVAEVPTETTTAEIISTTTTVSSIETTTTTTQTTTQTTTSTTTTTTTKTTQKQTLPKGYTNVSVETNNIYSGNLLEVNGNHIYQFPTGDTNIVTLYDHIKTEYYGVSDFEVKLDEEVIEHLNDLMQDFAETQNNTDIVIIGGYRSAEDQNQRYNNGISGVIAGFSDYHTGRSFDMGVFPQDGASSGYYSPTGVYAWIDEHAADYGFVVRFPEGKESFTNEISRTQTYRYVGVPHSTYMKRNNLCLEEYIEKIKSYTINKPLEISSGKDLYKVYYIGVDSGYTTQLGVPTEEDYEISGNNEDGFIITVKVN